MPAGFSRAAKHFFTPEALLPFLIGAVCMAVIGNEVTQVLNNWFGTTTKAALLIAGLALLVLAISAWLFARTLSRLLPPPIEFKQQAPEFRRGLILLVSRPETCRKALEYHLPILERCWVLCSAKTLGVAEELRGEFQGRLRMNHPIVINDVNNPLEFADRVDEIYTNLPAGWRVEDVIADYTGMTAHGSVGVAIACISPPRPLQYTPARYDEQMKPIAPLDPIEIRLVREQENNAPASLAESATKGVAL